MGLYSTTCRSKNYQIEMKSCPNCQSRLSITQLADSLTGLQCSSCNGHWIPSENYTRWIERKGGIEPELPADMGYDVVSNREERARICPDCSRIMIKARVGHEMSYHVDRCSQCQGIWLDANEWGSLKSRNLHDEIYMMYTSIWKQEMQES